MLHHRLHQIGKLADKPFIDADLSARQYAILSAIASSDRPTIQTDLVHMTGIDRSTLANICQRMQRKGYVTRTRGKRIDGVSDDRCIIVAITKSGRDYLTTAERVAFIADQSILNRIKPSRRDAFIKAIEDILSPASAEAA